MQGDDAGDDNWDSVDEIANGNSVNNPPENDIEFQIGGDSGQASSSSTSDSTQEDPIADGWFIPDDNIRDSRDDEVYASNNNQESREDDIDQRDDDIGGDEYDVPDVPDDGDDNSDPDEWDPYINDPDGDLFKPSQRAKPMNSEEYFALDGKINELDFKYETLAGIVMETQERLREGFAMSAAIAARPTPKDYGLHFTAGAGNYDSVNAVSMGFIYAHEDFTISVGHAKSDTGGPTMTNIGISYNLSSLFKKI